MSTQKHTPIKLTSNTDSIDIDQKSLGLDVTPNDYSDNRGLHIQIRHNGTKGTFNAAVHLKDHIVKAVNLHEELIAALTKLVDSNLNGKEQTRMSVEEFGKIYQLLKKAKGE